jgi:hypothetical protein
MRDLTKPLTRIVRGCNVGYRMNSNPRVTLRPRGIVTIRELRRKQEHHFDLGQLLTSRLIGDALLAARRKR